MTEEGGGESNGEKSEAQNDTFGPPRRCASSLPPVNWFVNCVVFGVIGQREKGPILTS